MAKQPLQSVAVAAWPELAAPVPATARAAVAARQRTPKAKRGNTAFLPPGPWTARWTASFRRRLPFVHHSTPLCLPSRYPVGGVRRFSLRRSRGSGYRALVGARGAG